MSEINRDLLSSIEGLEVITWSVPESSNPEFPYLTGVFAEGSDPWESEPYQEQGSLTKDEAMATHRDILSAWNGAEEGVCIKCQGEGWIAGSKHFCDSSRGGVWHESKVCTECSFYGDGPCEKHPNYCEECESVDKPCEKHAQQEDHEEWLEE